MTFRLGELLYAALVYARRGWAVFPVQTIRGRGCSCFLREKCNAIGKHPAIKKGWESRATTDEKQIAYWWRKTPYNIGVVTGSKSNLVVLDVDDKNGKRGSETLAKLLSEYRWMARTLTATTGNGKHLYFRYPKIEVRTQIEGLGEGLDAKAEGGYVVAPPSYHASFRHYKWSDPTAAIEELPQWLINLLTKPRPERNVAPRMATPARIWQKAGAQIEEGTRNVTLFRRGCAMRGQGYELSAIETELFRLDASCCNPPLGESEVRQIAVRVIAYPPGFANGQKQIEQQFQ